MVVDLKTSSESNQTPVAVNISGATIAFNNSNEDSDEDEDDDDDERKNTDLQIIDSSLPSNANVNIENSSDVVIGTVTQFHGPVTIYQNTPLPLEYKSSSVDALTNKEGSHETANTSSRAKLVPNTFRKLSYRSKVIISLIVLVLLTVTISCTVLLTNIEKASGNSTPAELVDSNNKTSRHKLIYRNGWGGRNPLYERQMELPVGYVIISHTAGKQCTSITECSATMVQIQSMHVAQGSPDVGYNFVIGGDENVYVARGWNAHNFHMNLDSIGICFTGNYIYDVLSPGMIEAAQQLLKYGAENGKLTNDFKLVAHNQTYNTLSPGPNIYNQIKFWPHFTPEVVADVDGL